jgi:hypothetical protein
MQLDPDQREWLYREEQERLRLQRRMKSARENRANWAMALAGAAVLVLLVAIIVSSDTFAEMLRWLSTLA